MLAGWFEKCGVADEVIVVGETQTPTVGPGEVLVRLHASGINPSDYKRRANVKAGPEFPRVIPHSDGAGVVAALGAGAQGFSIGDRVWVFNAQWARPDGTAAEFVRLPAAQVRHLPESMSFEEGACLGIPAMTAYRCVFANGPVKGQIVYVPAATGRVGAYAIQFAKWGGARVIASAGSPESCAVAVSLGAEVAFNRKSDNIEARILEHTQGYGVDRVIEIDFGANLEMDERIVAEGGAIASYGAVVQPKATLTLAGRRARNLSLQFVFVYLLKPGVVDDTCAGILRAQADGALTHRIAGVVPLSELARAHREAESQAGTGHMVVSIP